MVARLHKAIREPAFKFIKQLQYDGTFRSYLEVTCAKCHRLEKVPWTSAAVPDFVKKKMVALGWTFDPLKKSACVCQLCNKRTHDPVVPVETAPVETAVNAALMATRYLHDLTPEAEPVGGVMGVRTKHVTPTPPVILKKEKRMVQTTHNRPHIVRGVDPAADHGAIPVEQPGLPRPLTPDERMKVRHLLDSNFDDAAGYYISGYSDQRVGQELNVPWAAVAQIREAAYGPLREDERLVKLRVEYAALKADFNKMDALLKSQFAAEVHRLNEALRNFNTKMTAIENRLKEMDHD